MVNQQRLKVPTLMPALNYCYGQKKVELEILKHQMWLIKLFNQR